MGWLKYNPNTNKYYNWCNIECKGGVTEKNGDKKIIGKIILITNLML